MFFSHLYTYAWILNYIDNHGLCSGFAMAFTDMKVEGDSLLHGSLDWRGSLTGPRHRIDTPWMWIYKRQIVEHPGFFTSSCKLHMWDHAGDI